jgi:hypothetical protein
MNNDALIAALRHELDGYIRRGMAERAKAVQEVLAQLGCSLATPPAEIVPSELGGTPSTPTTRVRKPAQPAKAPEAPKTPEKKKKSSK